MGDAKTLNLMAEKNGLIPLGQARTKPREAGLA